MKSESVQNLKYNVSSTLALNILSRSYQLERLILRDCHWVTRDSLEYHTFKQGEPRQQQSFTKLSELSSQVSGQVDTLLLAIKANT